ncbi:MAG: hypothetical protein U9P12_04200 [Verrucomicrobiota bacterium]|nr:hypothetical protein [Verrucomicrobiota bacterium]
MYMGKIAGMNAAGVPTEFGGIPRSHLLKVLGKPMLSIGTVKATDGSYRMVEDHADSGYRMFMFRDGRFAGCLLIGRLKLMKPVRKAGNNGGGNCTVPLGLRGLELPIAPFSSVGSRCRDRFTRRESGVPYERNPFPRKTLSLSLFG